MNISAMRNRPAGLRPAELEDYGTETAEQRIARREQRWTPVAGVI